MTPPQRLRALLAEPAFVPVPAVWDGLSARLAVAAGFQAIFVSGLCVAAARLGGPDLDLVSFGEMLDSLRMVREAAPSALILADGDHGFGNAMNVQRTVRAYAAAGAAAIMVEDKVTPRTLSASGKPCLTRQAAQMKIRAAVSAAKESGILVLARTDCRPTLGIDEAAARLALFVIEGADILLLDSPESEDEIRLAVAASQGRPTFCVISPGSAWTSPSPQRAAELGVRIGTFPGSLLSPAIAAMQAGLRALADGRAAAPAAPTLNALRETLGYTDYENHARQFAAPA